MSFQAHKLMLMTIATNATPDGAVPSDPGVPPGAPEGKLHTMAETDQERAERHERERIEANERHERERKEAHDRHEEERKAARARREEERKNQRG